MKFPTDFAGYTFRKVSGQHLEEVSTPPEITRLREVRLRLLHLHQTLLESQRKTFEKTHGRISSGELLQLVINHEQFAWLRILSALVVHIDEMLDTDEPATDAALINLITEARELFTTSDNKEFHDKYQSALQHEPEVVIAHSALMKLLRSKN
jgi:hypothetical protein